MIRDTIHAIAIGDINGDGTNDTIVGSADSTVYALNSATGDLLWSNTAPTSDVLTIAIGDLNGDGISDVLAGSSDSNVYSINGLTGDTMWINTIPSDYVTTVALGTFSNDGTNNSLVGSLDGNVYSLKGGIEPPQVSEIIISYTSIIVISSIIPILITRKRNKSSQ